MYAIKKTMLALGIIFVLAILIVQPQAFRMLGPLAIGGVITQGILGGFSGKVGNVVGGKWKATNYMRSWVIPANPNSARQQAQRGSMGRIVLIAQGILSTVLQTYWDPFQSKMSGYNAFVKQNIKKLSSPTFLLGANLEISKGSLTSVPAVTATYTTGTGVIAATWSDNSGSGNALGTDAYVMVVFKTDGTILGVQESTVNHLARTDGGDGLTVAPGLTAADVVFFICFHRGTGPTLMVSNSCGDVCAAP